MLWFTRDPKSPSPLFRQILEGIRQRIADGALPPGARPWETLFAEAGVAVTPGGHFYATPPQETALRLSISPRNDAEIEEGVRRLAQALGAGRKLPPERHPRTPKEEPS